MASGTVAPDVRTAWQKCKQGDWEGARADLEAIVAARPDDLEARVCCGRVLAMRRMPEAEGHLRAALAIAPDDAAAVLALAQFLSLERRMAEAAALYRQVLAADPDSLDALLGLAKAQARMGRFEDVCATYRRAIDAHPANAKVCTRFSMFLASHALKWADAAAERDPGAETAVAKATALKMLGRLDEAQSAVQAGLAARPDDPVLHGEAAVLRSLRSGPAQRRRPAIFPRRIQDAAEFEAAIRQGVLPGAAPAEPILSPSSRLVTLGSCFAEHLALTLRGRGVEVHFQKRSEGFDNLYATRFLLDRAMRADQADPTFAVLADKLRAADAVILSLGVSAAYFDRETGEYLPPGLGVDQATLAAGAAFRMLSVEENLGLLRDVVGRFRALRPGVPIVLTLSPVPLAATFDRPAAVQADAVSKSTLRVVADRIMADGDPGLYYWPSYEIVRWLGVYAPPELGPVFGAEDQATRHVSSWVVALIMKLFLQSFGTGFDLSAPDGTATPFWLAGAGRAPVAG